MFAIYIYILYICPINNLLIKTKKVMKFEIEKYFNETLKECVSERKGIVDSLKKLWEEVRFKNLFGKGHLTNFQLYYMHGRPVDGNAYCMKICSSRSVVNVQEERRYTDVIRITHPMEVISFMTDAEVAYLLHRGHIDIRQTKSLKHKKVLHQYIKE